MKRGFSMVEAIVSVIVIGIIASILSLFIRSSFDAWFFLNRQEKISSEARSTLAQMSSEVKRIKQNTNILTYTSSELSFIDLDDNTITYSQEGTSLYRNGVDVLGRLQDPGGIVFTYLAEDGSVAATKQDISAIRFKLTLVIGSNRYASESAAWIRPRRY